MAFFLFAFFLLLLVYFFLIEFYRRSWHNIPEQNIKNELHEAVKVSLIIAVRNEQGLIHGVVSSLSRQQYAQDSFEVIFINDHSSDDTWLMLQNLPVSSLSIKIL